jgi:hypothetical protein
VWQAESVCDSRRWRSHLHVIQNTEGKATLRNCHVTICAQVPGPWRLPSSKTTHIVIPALTAVWDCRWAPCDFSGRHSRDLTAGGPVWGVFSHWRDFLIGGWRGLWCCSTCPLIWKTSLGERIESAWRSDVPRVEELTVPPLTQFFLTKIENNCYFSI